MLKLSKGHNIINNIKNVNNTVIEKVKRASENVEAKIKGTIVENWVKYWKNVYIDYREVVFDVGRDAKEKPAKAVVNISLLGTIVYFFKQNPDANSYQDAVIVSKNKLLLVHPSLQKPETTEHLKYVQQCYNNRTIRRLNLGIASVIWTDYYSTACTNCEANCPYLQFQYKKLKDRTLDIGFLNRWWILEKKMENYDINY